MSDAHVSPDARLFSHGGARNRADRTSDALKLDKAQEIIAAAYKAIAIEKPFNRFVTMHLERAGLSDADAAIAIGRILKLGADWMRKHDGQIAYAWVRENDAGDGSKGSHVHILCHCPDGLPIGRMWRRWLRQITNAPYRPKTIKSERIGGTLNAHASNPALYLQNLDRVLAYIVKGVTPADAAILSLPKQEAGGRIIGKRSGCSQNVRPKNTGPR